MALRPEITETLKRQAAAIQDKHDKEFADMEKAWAKRDAHKAKVKQTLIQCNQLIAGDSDLKQAIKTIVPSHKKHKEFLDVKGLNGFILSIEGVPFASCSGQSAVITSEGIKILKSHQLAKWNSGIGHYQVEYFEEIDLESSEAGYLFSDMRLPKGNQPEKILRALLQSPNRK